MINLKWKKFLGAEVKPVITIADQRNSATIKNDNSQQCVDLQQHKKRNGHCFFGDKLIEFVFLHIH